MRVDRIHLLLQFENIKTICHFIVDMIKKSYKPKENLFNQRKKEQDSQSLYWVFQVPIWEGQEQFNEPVSKCQKCTKNLVWFAVIFWIFFILILINGKSDKSVFLCYLYKIKLIVSMNGSNLGTKIDLSSLHTNYAVGNWITIAFLTWKGLLFVRGRSQTTFTREEG